MKMGRGGYAGLYRLRSGVMAGAVALVGLTAGSAGIPTARAQAAPAGSLAVMPQPVSVERADGRFAITQATIFSITGKSSSRLERGVARTQQRLEDKSGLMLPRRIGHAAAAGSIEVTVRADDTPVQGLEEDESYRLSVTAGSVKLEAATTTGALHGLETLFQLVQTAPGGYTIPAVMIEDAPRFRWRGLMIDCARHFEPIEVLKRNIDAMAAVKLNVFHWHLIDDQGFRIESKVYPKLTGAGSDGKFYSQEEARELVAYARDRGIRVVPEFEMPGHSAAWLFAYPELSSGTTPTGIRREFGVSDSAIDPTREETYEFIARFLQEMTTIFPDRYVHIGGDETPAPDWKTNPKILAFSKSHNLKDNDALQAYFNQRVLAILTRLNRRMVGWDEIFNPALPKDVVIQSWRGEASLAAAAVQGYQGVLSAPYYLDGMKPAEVHYLADPVPVDTKLTAAQQKLILGGEVCMWAEQLDERTLESRVWPRTAAIAERFWSKQTVRDTDDMYRRLDLVSLELQTLGVRHLTSEDTRLRDLAGTQQIDALRTVANAMEPVSFGDRYNEQHTSQLTPLTNFVDAVRPDPPLRHRLALATREFLAAAPGARQGVASRAELVQFFAGVEAALPEARRLAGESPRLGLIQPRLGQLDGLAKIGLQAVESLTNDTGAPAGWKASSLAAIEAAKQPSAIVRFHFLDSLEELVKATR